LAEAWEREARACHKAGLPIPQPGDTDQPALTLAEFFKERRDVIWRGKLPRNVEANQRACERFLGASTKITSITERTLMDTVTAMIRAGNAAGTINTRLSHLRVLLRHAKSLEIVSKVPDFPWQEKGDNSRMRFLTEDEERQLLALLDHWGLTVEANLVRVLIDTGCRPSEIIFGESRGVPIKWSEVSRSAGGSAPDVNDPATGSAKAVISLMRTKTGKYRVLPLTDRARDAFLASKEAGDKRPFGNVRADDLSATIRKAADHLGFDDVVLYTMRHTCASRLVQRGADIRRVMQWMGHTNINTTLKYAKLTPTDIFSIGELL
jgi:integrase